MTRMTAYARRAAVASGLVCLCVPSIAAHDKHAAGRFQMSIGWSDEPAFTGAKNAVSVVIASTGTPAPPPAAIVLSVDVTFDGQHMTFPLRPVWGRPEEFRAWLIPTRAGTYAFHVTGKIGEQVVDVQSTCSERTFDCVADASALHFPVKDPSAGELAESVGRALPRADRAGSVASSARAIAIGALAVAAIALAIALRPRGPRT